MSGPWKYGRDALALTVGAWRTWANCRTLWAALPLIVGACARRLRRAMTLPSCE